MVKEIPKVKTVIVEKEVEKPQPIVTTYIIEHEEKPAQESSGITVVSI